MGKKTKTKTTGTMKLSSLFRIGSGGFFSLPLCYNAQTLSFRLGDNDVVKTVDSLFFDHRRHDGDLLEAETPESWFTNLSETASHSTESDQDLDAESLEMVVRGVVRSERLFFDPEVTSSILEETDDKSKSEADTAAGEDPEEEDDSANTLPAAAIEEISVAVAIESEDPYGDFRRSMEEMVRSHGELVKDWRSLESMLAWYLRMNGRRSHGVIVSAFVDILSGLSDSGAAASESACYSTAMSSLPSSPVYSSCQGQTEIEEEERRSG